MSVVAKCPKCGGEVNFRIGTSIVTVCEFCSTAVARSDRGLEDHGRVVDLIESASPLDLWLAGRYGEARFEIVGRTQIKHGMGGVWDEWYCAFDSGHWGWLAEAQGRYYMSFRTPVEGIPPAFQGLRPGQKVEGVGDGQLLVAELGEAHILGAKGEIPYLLEPGTSYHYADLNGPDGAFATLDYGADGTPDFYLGKEVTLAQLGISVATPAREVAYGEAGQAAKIEAKALECPNCRGSLDLVAPDQCERVGCPFCGALSDVNQGNLNVLQILDKSRFPDPPLPLGSKGVFEEQEMTVCGYMVRSTNWYGEHFYWDEYLLYHPHVGFRWLVESDGHWSYVEPVGIADVQTSFGGVKHKGTTFARFDSVTSSVEYCLGQFYWKVEMGEEVAMSEFIAPPLSISEERTATELNWSLSTYLPKEKVEAAFDITLKDPTPGTVGVNQPYTQKVIYKLCAVLLSCAVAAFFVLKSHNRGTQVLNQTFEFPATAKSESQVQFSEPFALEGERNLEVKATSAVNNSWVYAQFDLIGESTGATTFFDIPIEYYSGPDWKEGSNSETKYLGKVGSGLHTLRIATERKNWQRPMRIQVTIREGVLRLRYLLALFGFLLLLPLFTYLHHRSFEMKRWSDASHSAPWWVGGGEDSD